MNVSNADVALLALLSEEPMHPWQIDKEVRYRDMRFWTDLSQSAIYKQLRGLEATGFVQVRSEEADGRLRKVYSLTDDGAAALRERLCDLLTEPEHLRWGIDLGTYNVDLLPRNQALECLEEYRHKLEANIKGYRDLEAFLVEHECPIHRLAVARRPVHLLQAEIAWLDSFVEELKAAPAPAEPAAHE